MIRELHGRRARVRWRRHFASIMDSHHHEDFATMPTPDVFLRVATADDIDTLAGFAIAMAWETEHKRLDPATVRRGITTAINDSALGRYYIAERAGAAVGTLMLTHEWSDWRSADWWWIQSVYVTEDARRQGVFQALYRHVHALAETTPGVCGLRLYVERDNLRAQSTYAALGMQDTGYRVYEAALPWVDRIIEKS